MKKTIILFILAGIVSLQTMVGQPEGWNYVKKLVIDTTVVQGTLSDFPVAVILTTDNFDFSQAESDGSDIRFTDLDDIPLTFEREIHDAVNENAVYWVKTSGDMYMYYGNPDATDAANTSGGAWDSNYRTVWHMKDTEVFGNWYIPNSKSTFYYGAKVGENNPDEVNGNIGKAQSFNGINDNVTVSSVFSNPSAITLSAWVKPQSPTPVLDEVTGAVAAYSLRKLTADYSGSAVRIRRSSDDNEADIGFDDDGMLDIDALLTHVGTGGTDSGFVKIWYDQSGNGQDVEQTDQELQPLIVVDGEILTSSNKPMVKFNEHYLDGTVDMGDQYPDVSMNIVWEQTTDGTISEVPVIIGTNSAQGGLSVGFYYLAMFDLPYTNIRLWENDISSIGSFISDLKVQTGTYYNNGTSSQMRIYANGTQTGNERNNAKALDLGSGYASTKIRVGANENDTDPLSNAYIAEIILYDTVLSSTDRQLIEANQLSCYGFTSPVIVGKGRSAYQLEVCNNNFIAYINNDSIQTLANTGEYQHVVMTYNQDSLCLFVNGELKRSKNKSGSISSNSNNIVIGSKFTGIIDEVRISASARSAEWIENDYNSGNNSLLVFDQSGFDITDPGELTAGVEFDLGITNATDFSGDDLDGNLDVTVNSNIDTEGENEDGILFDGTLSFTSGATTITDLLLKTADTHTLTITIESITGARTIDVTVVAASPDTIVFITPERTINAGDVSDTITVKLYDIFGNVAVSSGVTTLDLATDDASGVFRNQANTGNITQVTIADGDSIAVFRYTSTSTGIHEITVSDNAEVIKEASQNITVNAMAASKIVITTPEHEISAGDTSDIITLQLQDDYDNPATRGVNTVISLESDTTGVFRNALNDSDIEEVIITSGESQISFRYTSTIAGTHTLSVNDTVTVDPLPGDSQEITVNPLAPDTVVFTTEPHTISAGDTSDIITIQLRDIYNNVALSNGGTTFSLETDLSGVFRDSINTSNITEVIIPDGKSEISFRFTSTTAGIHELTVSDNAETDPLSSINQNLTVNPLVASKIAFITPQDTISAGSSSDIITIQLQDEYGNEVAGDGETTVNLSSDLTGQFRDVADENTITSIVIGDEMSEASFRYTSNVPGIHELSAEDDAEVLDGDTQNLVVTPAAPVKIIITTDPQEISAGDTSDIISLKLYDLFDNTAVSSGTTTINLSSDLTGIFRDSLNATNITQVNIVDGDSVASFRYTTTLADTHTISVDDNAGSLTGDDQELIVTALAASKITFITPERSIFSGDTSEIITVQLQDTYDNIAVSSEEVIVTLKSDSAGVFRDADNIADTTYLIIPVDDSEASFRYTSTIEGTHVLTVADSADTDPLTSANQNLRVYPPLSVWVGGDSGNENDWHTAANWNPQAVPGSGSYIRIPAVSDDPVISSDVTVRYLDIESDALLTVGSGQTLTIDSTGVLTINNGGEINAEGNLTTDEDALLIMQPGGKLTVDGTMTNNAGTEGFIIESDATATGSAILSNSVSATVQRYITGNKWHIVATPVTSQGIQSFLSGNNISYNPNTGAYGMTHYSENPDGWLNFYTSSTSGNLTVSRGYLLRRDNDSVVAFAGSTITGNPNVTLYRTSKGWNAIGNPFVSSVGVTDIATSSENFLEENASLLDSSYAGLYVWDEPDVRVSGVSYYKIINNAEPSGRFIKPGYLQPGQGFLVKALEDNVEVTFSSLMQAHEGAATFYKKSTRTPWPTIYLKAKTTTKEASTLIAFNERMSRGLDITYDAGLLGGDPALKLYTRLAYDNGVNFAIQCLPDMETAELIVPVGISIPDGGTVIFSAEIPSLPAGYKAILEDRQLGIFTDLQAHESTYSTGIPSGTSGTGRFFLHLVTATTDINPVDNQKINIFAYGKEIYIQGPVQEASNALIFDLTGRLMKTTRLEPDPANLNVIRVDELKSGIYIVRIEGKGRLETGKVFVE